jgi:hypothetical protein
MGNGQSIHPRHSNRTFSNERYSARPCRSRPVPFLGPVWIVVGPLRSHVFFGSIVPSIPQLALRIPFGLRAGECGIGVQEPDSSFRTVPTRGHG